MKQNFLASYSKVVSAAFSIAFATSGFSPVVGQTALNPSAQQLLAQQFDIQKSDNIQQVEVVELPISVAKAILQDLSQRTGVAISNMRIIESEEKEWLDSCLELVSEGEECFDIVTSGWLVTVFSLEELYVYHTNDSASIIKLKQANPKSQSPP